MLKGLELFKTLKRDDKVVFRGDVYTVISADTDYDFSVRPTKTFTCSVELKGKDYYYLKNLPGDPTLPIINALMPVENPLIGMAFGL